VGLYRRLIIFCAYDVVVAPWCKFYAKVQL
jgi:hypothetical protein